MKEAIRASDLVVIPLNARPDDMRQAMTTAAECGGLDDPVPCAALLNRVKSNELSSMQVARASLIGAGVPVLTTVIPDWAEIGHAFGSVVGDASRGMSVCVVDADPQASASCWHGDAALASATRRAGQARRPR